MTEELAITMKGGIWVEVTREGVIEPFGIGGNLGCDCICLIDIGCDCGCVIYATCTS